MTILFRRASRIIVGDLEIVGGASLDVAFTVTRSLKPEPNTAEVQIYNLSSTSRSKLEEFDRVPVTIEAGYSDRMSLIFSGVMRETYTYREGPDLITVIGTGDGEKEYQQSRINVSIAKGTDNATVIKKIAAAMAIDLGNLDQLSPQLNAAQLLYPSGGVLSGSAAQILSRSLQSLGFEWSSQQGAIQILRVGDAIQSTAVYLTPETGLIATPSVDSKGILSATCLMIPDIFPGRLISIESQRLSGAYRVEKCAYTGDTFGGTWSINLAAKKL